MARIVPTGIIATLNYIKLFPTQVEETELLSARVLSQFAKVSALVAKLLPTYGLKLEALLSLPTYG